MERKRERIYWLDIARASGIILVSLNHAVNRSYDNYDFQQSEYLSIPFCSTVLKAFVTVLSHLGVPLFLMISGALLLKKKMDSQEDVRFFYRHNFLPLFITSAIWFVLIYFYLVFGQTIFRGIVPTSASELAGILTGLLKTLLFVDQNTFASMWYIPMILCVYMVIPLLAAAVRRIGLKPLMLPCIIVLLDAMILPNLKSLSLVTGHELSFSFALKHTYIFSYYLVYIIAGYWISCGGLERLSSWGLAALLPCSVLIHCALQLYIYSQPENYLLGYDFIGIFFTGLLLFEGIRRFGLSDRCRKRKAVSYLAKISFGIYFLHIVIMTALDVLPFVEAAAPPLRLLILEFGALLLSVLVIAIGSHNQWCKQYLFFVKE